MRVELRGTIRAALGTGSLEVDVPERGVPLSELLESLARANSRAGRYLVDAGGGQAALRVVHNGAVVQRGLDPLVRPDDSVLLMHAVAGGERPPSGLS